MKKIIEGVTYNTDTSTKVAVRRKRHENDKYVTLYQTKKGKFFWHIQNYERSDGHLQDFWFSSAKDFIEKEADEVFLNPLSQDEASQRQTSFLMRIPVSLKSAAEAAAEADGLSLNSWMLRCAERCIQARTAQSV